MGRFVSAKVRVWYQQNHISAVSAAWVRLLPNVHSQDVKRLVTQAIALRDWIKDYYQ